MAIAIVLLLDGGLMLCIDHITINQKFGDPEKYINGFQPKTEKVVVIDEHWPWLTLAVGGFLFLVANGMSNAPAPAPKPPEPKH